VVGVTSGNLGLALRAGFISMVTSFAVQGVMDDITSSGQAPPQSSGATTSRALVSYDQATTLPPVTVEAPRVPPCASTLVGCLTPAGGTGGPGPGIWNGLYSGIVGGVVNTWNGLVPYKAAHTAGQAWQTGNYGTWAAYEIAIGVHWATLGIAPGAGGIKTAAQRISELAEMSLSRIQRERFITLGLVETEEGVRIIASSEGALRPLTLESLQAGEIAVTGVGHGEIIAYSAALELGYTPTGVAASRLICPDCANFFEELGIPLLSPSRLK
jgi:hypothetical protein